MRTRTKKKKRRKPSGYLLYQRQRVVFSLAMWVNVMAIYFLIIAREINFHVKELDLMLGQAYIHSTKATYLARVVRGNYRYVMA